jgi:hypothetical protein
VVVVVANSILEASRRSRRLNAPHEPFADQDVQGVVHGLVGDGADLRPDDLSHAVGGNVGLPRHRTQDS